MSDKDIRYKRRIKRIEVMQNMTLEELCIAEGRYCGPNNEFLCEKKYGITLSLVEVQNEIACRLILGE